MSEKGLPFSGVWTNGKKTMKSITDAAVLLTEDLVHAESGSDLESKIILAHLIKFREESLDSFKEMMKKAAQERGVENAYLFMNEYVV